MSESCLQISHFFWQFFRKPNSVCLLLLLWLFVGCGRHIPVRGASAKTHASKSTKRVTKTTSFRALRMEGFQKKKHHHSDRRSIPPLPRGCENAEQCYKNGKLALEHKKYTIGLSLLGAACDQNFGPACNALATIYAIGHGVPKNYKKGLELFRRSCHARELRDCVVAGMFYQRGVGIPINNQEAFTYYMFACKGGDMEGCYKGGMLHVKGLLSPREIFIARALFEKACQHEHQKSCDEIRTMWKAIPGANLRSAHLTVNGLTTEELICRLEGSGLINSENVVGSLAIYKETLFRCVKEPKRPRVRWKFISGRIIVEEIRGEVSSRAKQCITKALRLVKSKIIGICSSLIEIGHQPIKKN